MLCSWAGHFALTVPLSIQVYKMGNSELLGHTDKMLEVTVCNRLASHPLSGTGTDEPSGSADP